MDVKKIRKAPYWGVVVSGSWLDQFIRDDGNPPKLFTGEFRPLKSSISARTAIIDIGRFGYKSARREIYAKEFFYKNLLHSFKPIFRMHRAQILWRNSWNLLRYGVNVPEPAGYLLHQVGPSCRGAYFFAEALTECDNLGNLARNFAELNQRLDQGGLIETLALTVASMHNRGVIHGDLKWSNIMVHLKENKVWFIDLDAAEIYRIMPVSSRIARDVARFVLNGMEVGIDTSIVDRFLDQYAIQRKLSRHSIERPVAKMLRMLQKKHHKKYHGQ